MLISLHLPQPHLLKTDEENTVDIKNDKQKLNNNYSKGFRVAILYYKKFMTTKFDHQSFILKKETTTTPNTH